MKPISVRLLPPVPGMDPVFKIGPGCLLEVDEARRAVWLTERTRRLRLPLDACLFTFEPPEPEPPKVPPKPPPAPVTIEPRKRK